MIYLDNNSEIQQVWIPRETLNIETVVPIPNDQFSDYYTKSEVDALIDGVEVDLSDYYTKEEIDENEKVVSAALNDLNEGLKSKQPTLVSGVNIKTINGQTILGSGNITVEGGGTSAAGRTAVLYYPMNYTYTTVATGVKKTVNYANDVDGVRTHNLQVINDILAGNIDTVYLQYRLSGVTVYEEDGITEKYKTYPVWIYVPMTFQDDYTDFLTFTGWYNNTSGNTLTNFYQLGLQLYKSDAKINGKLTKTTVSQQFKTINGQSIKGEGDIVIEGGSGGSADLSDYYTKKDIDALLADNYYTIKDIDAMVGDINTLLTTI